MAIRKWWEKILGIDEDDKSSSSSTSSTQANMTAKEIEEEEKSFYERTKNLVSNAIEDVGDWVEDKVDDVKDWVEDAAEDVEVWVEDKADDVEDWVKNTYTNTKTWVANAYDDVEDWVDDRVDDVEDFVEDTVDWTKQAAEDTKEWVKDIVVDKPAVPTSTYIPIPTPCKKIPSESNSVAAKNIPDHVKDIMWREEQDAQMYDSDRYKNHDWSGTSASPTYRYLNSDIEDRISLSAGLSDASNFYGNSYSDDVMPLVYDPEVWDKMQQGSSVPLLPYDLDEYPYNKWYLFDPDKFIEDSKGLNLNDIENGLKIIDTVDKVVTGYEVVKGVKSTYSMKDVMQFSDNHDRLNIGSGKVLMKFGNEENGYQPMSSTEAAMAVDLYPVLIQENADAFNYRSGLALALEVGATSSDFGMGSVTGNSRMQQTVNLADQLVKNVALPILESAGGIFPLGSAYYQAIDILYDGENRFEVHSISGDDGKQN